MSTEPPIVGTLRCWRKHVCRPDGTFVIWGHIYDDVLNRFYDGQFIHTAKILRVDGDLAYTANSAYRLEDEAIGPEYKSCILSEAS